MQHSQDELTPEQEARLADAFEVDDDVVEYEEGVTLDEQADEERHQYLGDPIARHALSLGMAQGNAGLTPLGRSRPRGRPRAGATPSPGAGTRRAVVLDKNTSRLKRFQTSVTIWKRGGVGDHEWDGICKFLHEKQDADPDFKAFFAVEKGPREGGLHLQGVLDIKTTSTIKINGMLRQAIKDPECTDKIKETKVMCKALTGKHLHTFHGMVGYCQKDIGRPHYKFHMIGIDQEDLDEGMHQYTLHGAGDVKGRTALDCKTLLSKIEMWYKFKCGSDANIDVVTILRDMLRSGNFYPTMTWIMPSGGVGLSQERLQVMFNIMKNWEATTRSDVRAIFMAPDVRYSDMHMELAEQSSVVNLRDWQKELVDAMHADPHPRAVMWWW